MLGKLLASAGLALVLGASAPAFADVTVHLMHVNQANDPLWKAIAEAYNKSHPGTTVVVDYMENEAYKAKLPTLLQSADKPGIIFSWGGGVMRAQIEAGYVQDISASKGDLDKTVYPAGLSAFTVDGKLYGVPTDFNEVSIYYNKALFKKANLDPASMGTWDGFLAGVKTLKAAGITPIVMGGGEKWPMHFYYSYLLMRIGGQDVLKNAEAGKDGGFKGPAFIEAGKKLKELSDLQPYQEGWLGTLFPASTGLFGDGKGAMDLMGNWILGMQGANAADGKGIPPDQLGMLPFPTIDGGKGKITDTFGGIGGLLVTDGAPPEAIDFLKYFETADSQKAPAEAAAYVPAVKGTDAFIKDPFVAQVAKDIGNSTWHQNFLDQDLGPSVGRVVNDMSVAIAAGQSSPEDAAAAIQDAWDTK
jgi:raffinose/stachyose/melibiose transport system substrate-binding protein